jgi:hypothetical protein
MLSLGTCKKKSHSMRECVWMTKRGRHVIILRMHATSSNATFDCMMSRVSAQARRHGIDHAARPQKASVQASSSCRLLEPMPPVAYR